MTDDQADRVVYAGRILTLRLKHVPHLREIVEHLPGAAAVAVDADGQVLLVRQWRPAVGSSVLELPAGLIDPGETPIQTAKRELEEETGYAADTLEPLVAFYTSPGFTDELIHIFAADGLRKTAMRHDDQEQIEVVRMPLQEALDRVMHGEISDAKTVAGLLAFASKARS